MSETALLFGAGGSTLTKLQLSRLQAESVRQQSEFRASQLETNARRADANADDAIKRGERDAFNVKTQGKRIIGAQRAALAAQGIDISDVESSAQDVQEDTAREVQLNAMTIQNNAWREAFNFKTQASDFRFGAELTRLSGRSEAEQIETAGAIQAVDDTTNIVGRFFGGG